MPCTSQVTNQKLLISMPQSITNYSPQSGPLFHLAVRATDVVRRRIDLDVAAPVAAKRRCQAVIVPANGLFQTERTRILQLALEARLPTIMANPQDVEVGGLASYGVDARENYRRAAAYVDKILKGAKPGDLPIEFPTKLMLAINLKTARALGLEVPLHVQQLADEVIE